jgi:hypothetical protein
MRLRSLTVFAIVLLLGAATAFAQGTTGTISGRVTDSQGLAMPGATITAQGAQGTRSAVSDSEGRYSIPFIVPGDYTVRAELAGFKSVERRNVTVRLSQTVELPLTMEVGAISEVVEVAATSPIVDMNSTTTGANLDSELLTRVPVGRKMTDALYLAPGVSSSGRTGTANPSVSGGSGLENQYIVDGVNITNSGYGAIGSYSIVFGSLGNGVTFDFIKEIEVKTAGYEAEFGQSTGGVINVITKSGTNNLRGSVFSYFQPDALESSYDQVQSENGTINTTAQSQHDVGFEVGGAVIQDKLFFFGALNPQWETRTVVAPQGFPLESLGDVDRKRNIVTYSAKGSYQVNSSHKIDASFFGDPATGDNGPQRMTSLLRTNTAAFSEIKYGGHNQVVRYDGVMTPTWLIEASFARAYNNIEETPSVDDWNVLDSTVTPQVRTGGIGFYEVGNKGTNMQYAAKATNIFGDHQIRYGMTYEDIKYDNIIDRTGPTINLPGLGSTVTGAEVTILPDPVFGRIYRVNRANLSNVRETEQEYLNFFIQDTWKVGSRLTIKPGLRYEQQKLVGNLAEFQWDGNWAPRLGVTYDPIGNGRSKIYGAWGRFFAKIPNDLAARALSADAGVTRADFFDAGLTQIVPNGTLAAGQTTHLVTAGLHPADFDDTSRSTYQDEFLVGGEYEIMPSLNVGVRYIYRDMPRVLEDIGSAAMVLYSQGAPGLESVEYFITNPREGYPATINNVGAFEDPIHHYKALEFTADKRFSNNWALQSSYRWSKLDGTFEGFFRNDNGQSDPAITSLYDFPTNDPSYTEIGVPQFGYRGDIRFLGALGEGPLPNDRTHQFKSYGSYALDNGLNLGAGLTFSSGRPLTAFAANPIYESDGEIPEGPRGSGIDTVDDGFRTRTPFEYDVNFHADYSFAMGGDRRLTLLADIFNLFNTQEARDYNQNTETSPTVPDPDYGVPSVDNQSRLARPFYLRLGLRFQF